MNFEKGKAKLIAIDLDGTLWPYDVGITIKGPFFMDDNGKVVNGQKNVVQTYKGIRSILQRLQRAGYVLAVVSRAKDSDGAKQLLKLFQWEEFFTYMVIGLETKTDHFRTLKKLSGFDFSEMVYFDDEEKNRNELKHIGVYTVVMKDGLDQELIQQGLAKVPKN